MQKLGYRMLRGNGGDDLKKTEKRKPIKAHENDVNHTSPVLITLMGLVPIVILLIYYWKNPTKFSVYSLMQAVIPLALVFTGIEGILIKRRS